ncbi:GNAT family N-acetyltransferase [Paracoccus sp. DMF]|uniref:GNAT family N-acetyltransferase n=1 Tax=Paracoccus sp. DMF TaxID=400837 RepID=UPI0021E4F1B9|nr:GNAT family N-acetyltransferase [Paracoccus sp. DMF]MCV2447488.1 GNAT family N-acetyltransferase [Paracoccus sp. DMF]
MTCWGAWPETARTFLAEKAYWSQGLDRPRLEPALAGALPMAVIAPDGAIAGFARLFMDYTVFAYLRGLFMLPAHRGRGLAEAIRTTPSLPESQLGCWRRAMPVRSVKKPVSARSRIPKLHGGAEGAVPSVRGSQWRTGQGAGNGLSHRRGVGGSFTDLAVLEEGSGQLRTLKVFSAPAPRGLRDEPADRPHVRRSGRPALKAPEKVPVTRPVGHALLFRRLHGASSSPAQWRRSTDAPRHAARQEGRGRIHRCGRSTA